MNETKQKKAPESSNGQPDTRESGLFVQEVEMNGIMSPKPLSKRAKVILAIVAIFILGIVYLGNGAKEERTVSIPPEQKLLYLFEQKGIWKADVANNRCLVDPAVWRALPFDKKEDMLRVIYREEATWWELYDMYTGKLLGKVDVWGVKIYP